MKLNIRQEILKDQGHIYQVIKSAFETAEHSDHDEHNLVNRLRKSKEFIPQLSLVAQYDDQIVGHILFTKINIGEHTSLALAPVSVLPEYQRTGIGSQLIQYGHRIAKELGYGSVVVLGHALYYPRFGYTTASTWHIKPPFDVPDENFMVVELFPNALKNIRGTVSYAKEFFEE